MAKCNIKSTFCLSLWSAWWNLMYWILHLGTNFLVINSCSRLYSGDHCIRGFLTNEQVCRLLVSPVMWVTSPESLILKRFRLFSTHCWLSKWIQKACHIWELFFLIFTEPSHSSPSISIQCQDFPGPVVKTLPSDTEGVGQEAKIHMPHSQNPKHKTEAIL